MVAFLSWKKQTLVKKLRNVYVVLFFLFNLTPRKKHTMESKKNPKADVSRNGSIYFAVGLALMLFLTYSTLNWKTYDKSDIDIGKLNLDDELEEEIPIIEQVIPPPPPPPPPAAPEVIEVVEDEEEIEETVIESTETDQDEEIIEVEEIEVEEVVEDVEVPFCSD